jgi:hypothetical protein
MSDPSPERALSGVRLVHVQLYEVPRETGEIHNISFGHGSSARGADAVESKIFEVQTQAKSPSALNESAQNGAALAAAASFTA